MELNGFNSDNYIYLKLNNDFESKNYDLKKGCILRFLRDDLEDKVYSRLISQGISEGLQYDRKKEVLDTDILPHQVNNSISFKEDTRASVVLWPHERYCLNDWMMEHLTNSEKFEHDFSNGFYGKCKDLNLEVIKRGCIEALPDKNRLPMIEVGEKNVELIFNFKKGEELDFQDPGVMSLLIDHEMVGLFSNSQVIEGKEKDELFTSDFQNAFFASNGIFRKDDSHIYHYYKVNDDVKAKSFTDFPYIYLDVASYGKDGFINYIYMETFSSMDFSRCGEEVIKKFAQEVPLEEARIMHRERLKIEEEEQQREMQEFHEREEKHAQELERAYEEKKAEESIFPGAGGEFVQTYNDGFDNDEKNKKYTLEEIKEFYSKLKDINQRILDYMYFYGGTIPYILTDANTSREFGDVDIFVPVEAMRYVREELQRQPSFEVDFDSIDVTSRVNLTSKIPGQKEDDTLGLAVLGALMGVGDEETLDNMFNNRPKGILQDFGLKGKLFGIKISIFPIYQYEKDLMAKSFNITDMYEYLLAVRVMNNTEVNSFAKNVQICGNNLHILPIEYVMISKESAIEHGFKKRADKDAEDLAYIEEHQEELAIDDELKEKLKENYPDYSIAMAYFVGPGGVEKIGGEKYKDLMLMNNGGWLSC